MKIVIFGGDFMRKLNRMISLFLILVMVFGVFVIAPFKVNAAGDTISNATSYTVGNTVSGSITTTNIKDVYEFNISTSGKISLSVIANMEHCEYYIHNSKGEVVWEEIDIEWDNVAELQSFEREFDLTYGVYYFSICKYSYGSGYVGDYEFKISFTSSNESFKETGNDKDNTLKSANSISLNKVYRGQIAVNDAKDFYKFTLSSSQKIAVTLNSYIERCEYYIYDSTGKKVWGAYEDHWDEITEILSVKEILSLSAGTYYFCVCEYSYGSGYTGNYDFSISQYNNLLATPKISKFEALSNGMNLKWNAISGAEKYGVYRKTEFDNSWKIIDITSGTSFTDKTAIAGNTYIYTLCCISADEKTITSSYDATGQKIKYATTPKLNTPTYVKDGVKISWSGSSNAVSYRVLCKYSGSNGWKKVGDTTSTSFTHKTGKTNRVYTYTVRCTTKSGKSYVSYFDTKGITKTFKKLATPKISKFEGVSNGIKLKWSSVSGAEKYCVFRKTDSDTDWKSVGITSGLNYTDKTAKTGKTYTYTLCCISSDGKNITSSYDAIGQRIKYATTPKLKNPSYVKGGVKISWNKSDNAVSYRVFCKYSGSGGWKKVGDTTSTSFTHKTGKKGRVYTYTVRCTTKSGKSYVSYFNTKGLSKKFKK